MTKSNFKKTMLLTMLLSLIIPIVKSENGITRTVIDGATYIVDTLTHYKTGPGTTFTEMRFSGETNNLVFKSFFIMSQVENNPNIKFRAETANDSIAGLKTITEHIKTRTKPGEYYIAGVNGDLQPAGVKNWGCNQNGVYATPPPPGLGHLVITNERTPWSTSLGNVLSMTLHGNTIKLDHINDERFTNELVVYNSMNGNYTHTQGGKEIAFELLGGESWKINSPVKGRITGETSDIGNMKIPKNGGVISASGTAITKIESLKEGDIIEVSIRQDLKYYGDITPNITQSIGAFHAIVRDGKAVYIADLARHPRTLVGYSKDKKHLIMCIVDGRQTASAGVTYPEMSDLMIYAGAYGALNFDGGGSSTMYTNSHGIMNNPSDGKERPVWSGLYIVLNAPEDNEVALIEPRDWKKIMPKYGEYTTVFHGFNKYGMLIDSDVKGVTITCPQELGTINNNKFTAINIGEIAIKANYKGIVTEIPVIIENCDNIELKSSMIINDTFNKYTIYLQSKNNGISTPISAKYLQWSVADVDVANVDSNGVLTGIKDGTTNVTGVLNDMTVSMDVVVQKPTSRVSAIDPDMDISTWKISQTGGKNLVAEPMENGMKISYVGASGRGPSIKLAKRMQLWSLPDTIRLRINPGDAPIKNVFISTNANKNGVVNTRFEAPKANEMNVINFVTSDWCDASDMSNYPIFINNISFTMGNSTIGTNYVIEIPGIEAVYKSVAVSGIEDVISAQESLTIFPNPVKQGEDIVITLSSDDVAEVAIYNNLGQQVKNSNITPANNRVLISTSSFSEAIYYVVVKQNNATKSGKILIKNI